MKKFFALLLVLTLAVSMVACGTSKPAETEPVKSETPEVVDNAVTEAVAAVEEAGEVPYIGISIFDYSNNFVGYIRNGIDYYMSESHPDVKYLMVDGENNQATQTERIDTMISKGVNVLLVNPVDSSAGDTILQKAVDAGIAIIFFNRQPSVDVLNSYDKCWYVGLDTYYQGQLEAELVAEAWEKDQAKWDANGDGKFQYVLLKGTPGHSDAEDRANGFKEKIAELGTPVELLAEEYANWATATAKDITETWIGKYGEQIELVVCGNDAMALGAVEALKGNGLITDSSVVPVVGVNALPEASQLVKDGVMLGSILTSTYSTAQACVDMALNAVAGNDILDGMDYELEDGKIVRIPETVITAENVQVAIDDYKTSK